MAAISILGSFVGHGRANLQAADGLAEDDGDQILGPDTRGLYCRPDQTATGQENAPRRTKYLDLRAIGEIETESPKSEQWRTARCYPAMTRPGSSCSDLIRIADRQAKGEGHADRRPCIRRYRGESAPFFRRNEVILC